MTRSAQASSDYDEDFYTWTQEQAVALRRLGEQGAIDARHLAEEIEYLGKRDLREVVSFLELLLRHLLKIDAEPDGPSVPHWRIEARAFARSAVKAFSPGMRRQIDVPALWDEAIGTLTADAKDLASPPPRHFACPFELDDLLSMDKDIDAALDKLRAAVSAG